MGNNIPQVFNTDRVDLWEAVTVFKEGNPKDTVTFVKGEAFVVYSGEVQRLA